MKMSDSEYGSESEYESESDDETENFYYELKKSNYFKNCISCRQVKNKQQILLDKCDALHDVTHMITDYYGCDRCCKLRNLFDDYIIPFTKVYEYPEYDEAHRILRDYVDKEKYTHELHVEMKTMYENLDKFEFYKWHQEKKKCFNDYDYFHHYQRVYTFFLEIIYSIIGFNRRLSSDHLKETTRFIQEMIVYNRV